MKFVLEEQADTGAWLLRGESATIREISEMVMRDITIGRAFRVTFGSATKHFIRER